MRLLGSFFAVLVFILGAGLFAYALWVPAGTDDAAAYGVATYYALMALTAFVAGGILVFVAAKTD